MAGYSTHVHSTCPLFLCPVIDTQVSHLQHWHMHLLESKLLGHVAEALLAFRGGLQLHFTTTAQHIEPPATHKGLDLSMLLIMCSFKVAVQPTAGF